MRWCAAPCGPDQARRAAGRGGDAAVANARAQADAGPRRPIDGDVPGAGVRAAADDADVAARVDQEAAAVGCESSQGPAYGPALADAAEVQLRPEVAGAGLGRGVVVRAWGRERRRCVEGAVVARILQGRAHKTG